MSETNKNKKPSEIDLTYGTNVGGNAPAPEPSQPLSTTPADQGNTYGNWITNALKGAVQIGSNVGAAYNSINNGVKKAASTVNAESPTVNAESPTYSGAWAGTAPVDSYEEFLRKKQETYDTIRDDAYASAERARKEAERKAEVERERSVVDANSSYEQNKASYGANAELMGNMGLSGSGYSDYLNSKAYLQQRSEVQFANAQADASKKEATSIEEQAREKADASYYQNILANDDAIGTHRKEVEEKATAVYTELLTAAKDGTYSLEEVKHLAKEYHLSEDQTNSIVSVATARVEKDQKENYNNFASLITSGIADTDEIDRASEAGDISPEQYNNLINQWNSSVDTSSNFFYSDGKILSKSAAKEALNSITGHSWCHATTKTYLQNSFNDLYSVKQIGGNLNASGRELSTSGDNYKVKIADTEYEVESGGKCTDEAVIEASADVDNNLMFAYHGDIYIRYGENVYKVDARPTCPEDFEALEDIFFGG